MSLSVTGWSVLSRAGLGREPFAAALTSGAMPPPMADSNGGPGAAPTSARGCPVIDLDVHALLGRKGTSSLDRRTVLTLVACRQALQDGGVIVDDTTRHRVGVALGTTWGSFQAMSDYTKDTYVEDRPYLVEPARFPNTVMNCPAGQAAIWFGLKGVNATLAGGTIAFVHALNYAWNLLTRGYADTILVGGVEELTTHTTWATYLLQDPATAAPAGEAAGVFVVRRAEDARERAVHGDVLSVSTGFAPGGAASRDTGAALERCIRRALDRASADPRDVSLVAMTAQTDRETCSAEWHALDRVFGRAGPQRIAPRAIFGECQAALGALQLAAVLALRSTDRPARLALLTTCTDDAAVGAIVVKA